MTARGSLHLITNNLNVHKHIACYSVVFTVLVVCSRAPSRCRSDVWTWSSGRGRRCNFLVHSSLASPAEISLTHSNTASYLKLILTAPKTGQQRRKWDFLSKRGEQHLLGRQTTAQMLTRTNVDLECLFKKRRVAV